MLVHPCSAWSNLRIPNHVASVQSQHVAISLVQGVLVDVCSPVLLQAYPCLCAWYAIYKLGRFSFYLLVPRHTSPYSLLANAMLMCRFAPPPRLQLHGRHRAAPRQELLPRPRRHRDRTLSPPASSLAPSCPLPDLVYLHTDIISPCNAEGLWFAVSLYMRACASPPTGSLMHRRVGRVQCRAPCAGACMDICWRA